MVTRPTWKHGNTVAGQVYSALRLSTQDGSVGLTAVRRRCCAPSTSRGGDFVFVVVSLVAIPVYVKHSISFRDSSSLGRFEITVGPKQTMGKTIEGVIVTSQMPKGVLNMSLTPSQGTHTFDPVTKVREPAGGMGRWGIEAAETPPASSPHLF